LAKVLWLKSRNSEVWLDRRTNYTRSLAVMSMVGYILGLGDRHPSNLMLSRHSGKVLHIDFGDCFDVAQHRDKYPEKVPFRLTRMLVNAMEVSGIEGTFRSTCENVMRVLRDNKESLMAVLEAFVYDPLINWRLLAPTTASPPGGATAHELDGDAADDGDNANAADADDDNDDNDNNGGGGKTLLGGAARGTIAGTVVAGSSQLSRSAETRAVTAVANSAANVAFTSDAGAAALALAAASADADTFGDEGPGAMPEVLNERALSVIARVSKKLTGRDFGAAAGTPPLDIPEQVQRLIVQATSHENLATLYVG
jgi:FKBP12-rapamycin complex-associated protein